MRLTPFTRPTVIAALDVLEQHSQASFNRLVLRLGLDDEIPSHTNVSVAAKCNLLGRAALQRTTQDVQTIDGKMSLVEAVVREALVLLTPDAAQHGPSALLRGLARDGYVVEWAHSGTAPPVLRAALPAEIDLPATDDEVHRLLIALRLDTPRGHLAQAVDAHTRGSWAAANAQLRTFLESLLDEIAYKIRPAEAPTLRTAENRRELLAKADFLTVSRAEWMPDGKSYINGLFKMLHTEGSHPGRSDEEHSTFRLHLVLVTARAFLRRLYYKQ
jgi:hypothetical protein